MNEEDAGPQLEHAESQPEAADTASKSPAVVFNITGDASEHGMDRNDDVIVDLARIQGAMSPRGGQHPPSTPTGRLQPIRSCPTPHMPLLCVMAGKQPI